jgi:hypothetical protein
MKKPALRSAASWVPITKSEAKRRGLIVESLLPIYRACDLGLVRDRSVWFEMSIPPRWTVALRLANQQGQPVIAEARVFPDEPGKHSPGRWTGEYGVTTTVPPGGLGARVLRQIRTQAFKSDLRKIMTSVVNDKAWAEVWAELSGEKLGSLFHGGPPSTVPPSATHGRKGRSDHELARIAATYARAWLADRPPIPAVAKTLGVSLTKARDAVHRARVRGLLSPANKQRQGGGQLTPLAREILKQDAKSKGGTRHAKR